MSLEQYWYGSHHQDLLRGEQNTCVNVSTQHQHTSQCRTLSLAHTRLQSLHTYHYMTTQKFDSCCGHRQLPRQLTPAELYRTAECCPQIQHDVDDHAPEQSRTTLRGR